MLDEQLAQIVNDLLQHEGLELKPYHCTMGKLTIGVGRNLEDRGITKEEALYLAANDARHWLTELNFHPWFRGLTWSRQRVIINMAHQMGIKGVLNFKNMIAAISRGDFAQAAIEMLNSKWATQTPKRARELAERMAKG